MCMHIHILSPHHPCSLHHALPLSTLPSPPLPFPSLHSLPPLPSPPLPSPPLPLHTLRTLIREIQSVVQPFTMVREWPENSDHLSQGLARYSLVTHSFGPLALGTGISSVLASLDDLQDIYEGKKQLNNPPVSCSPSSLPGGCVQAQQQQQMGIVPPPQPGPSHLGAGYVKQETGQHMDHNLDNCPVVMPTQFE